jgi:hypothetical protein
VTSLAEGMAELRCRHRLGHVKPHRKDVDISRRNIIDYSPTLEFKKKNHLLQTPFQTLYILADLSVKSRYLFS